MKLSRIFASEITRSKGAFTIEPVPPEKQPSNETLKRLEQEIKAQLEANEMTAFKSMNPD